jgi:hypothetical protein
LSILQGPIYYIAGRPTMVAPMRQMLVNAGVDEDDIRAEEFARYREDGELPLLTFFGGVGVDFVSLAREETMNSLKQLRDCGQSIWLDCIRRDLITSCEFQRLAEEDGGHVASNPTTL